MTGDHDIHNVAVVGAGTMGSQIAMLCALAGYHVHVYDVDAATMRSARAELERRMARDVEKNRRNQDEVDAAFTRLSWTGELADAVTTADFVIEAAVEKLDTKREIFAEIDRIAPSHAILVTNSSTIVSSKLSDVTHRGDRVCNMHFFNPALVMECVEVVRGPHTSEITVESTAALARSVGKTPVIVNTEIPGFLANRILNVIRDEAIFLADSEIASVEDIDTACRTALGHPMGPFELMDLTGIDIGYLAKLARYEDSKDTADLPARSVTRKVERGELGRKTGRGWYSYDDHGNKLKPIPWESEEQ